MCLDVFTKIPSALDNVHNKSIITLFLKYQNNPSKIKYLYTRVLSFNFELLPILSGRLV